MKVLWVLAAVVAVALSAPQPNGEIKEPDEHKKCQKLFPLDEAFLEKVRKQEKPDTIPENLGKHLICMYKENGLISEDGKVNKDKLKEKVSNDPTITEAKVNQVVDECGNINETELETTAKKLDECIRHQLGVPKLEHHDH